jgi:TorA maturation chaperone TorD
MADTSHGAFESTRGAERFRPQISDGPYREANRAVLIEAVDDGVDAIDTARMEEYALLATLLARAPDAALLKALTQLHGNSMPLGIAHSELAQAADNASSENLEREYFNLFIGLGRGELLPYGSYYLTGFLHERPLARLRADLAEIGIARVEGHREPEDHIAILCEIMAGLAGRRFAAPDGSERRIFERHLAPWAERFFADLEATPAATFYRHVARVGRLFIEIETAAFALPD